MWSVASGQSDPVGHGSSQFALDLNQNLTSILIPFPLLHPLTLTLSKPINNLVAMSLFKALLPGAWLHRYQSGGID